MPINSFSQYLVEEEKIAYFAFGRMNPPTIGHGKLLDKLASVAGRNPYRVFLSQSNDKKNPLQYNAKIKYVRKMFPKHARSVMMNKKVVTPFHALSALYDEGYRKVVMIAGSDRVKEYEQRLNMYNGKDGRHGFYNFKGGIKVVSAGQRDPDAEGAEGASGTKQRKYATDNDFQGFAQGLPNAMSNNDARRLFNDVRKGMGLKENKNFKNVLQLERSEHREAYVEGQLFKEGDEVIIKSSNEVGQITVCGTNYVIVEANGNKTRQWLDSIEKIQEWVCGQCNNDPCTCESIDEAAKPRWKKAGPNGEIEITIKGQRYKIEKALDHNERHKGEFKIMMWDARRRSWEWDNTVQGKAYAKELVMDKLDEANNPAYHRGLSKSTKDKRKAQFAKQAKMSDDNPAAYKPAPGDKTAKTKPSRHTMKFKQMFGDD